MGFRLNEVSCWIVSVVVAALIFTADTFLAGAEFKRPINYILAGLVSVYLLTSTHVCLRLIGWLSARKALSRVLVVVVTTALLLALSWSVFGAYFFATAKLGYESTEHLRLDIFVRQALQIQVGSVPLLCALLVKKEGGIDLIAAVVVAAFIMIVANF